MSSSSSKTPFHIVKPSFWPLAVSIFVFTTLLYTILQFHYKNFFDTSFLLTFSIFLIIWTAGSWWFDICIEAFRGGHHTIKVQLGIRLAMALFIISEVMFFFGFFWAFFHSSLAPSVAIGGVWPPQGIQLISAYDVPLLNTAILLFSGILVTWSHRAILSNDFEFALDSLAATIFLALLFTRLQYNEYTDSKFLISDSIYGSCFYLMTGFHGIHVFIGTCFLCVCLVRMESSHFSRYYHFGFEAAIWYWHFVDVVWIFLFFFVYWWGGSVITYVIYFLHG